jgi:hypothetical protein
MAEIQPEHIHARFKKPPDHLRAAGDGTDGGNDLGIPGATKTGTGEGHVTASSPG